MNDINNKMNNNFMFNNNNFNMNNMNMNMFNNINNNMNQINNIGMNIPSFNNNMVNINNNFGFINNNFNNNFNISYNIQKINNININKAKLSKLNNNIIDILDCFEYNQKIELLKDCDKTFCNHCMKVADSYYSSSLETLPKILIILLKQEDKINNKIKLEFNTILDITNCVSQKNGNQNIKYKLIGVISHSGDNKNNTQYFAHCLSPIDAKLYTYNDAMVNEIDNFQKDIINTGIYDILFYKKIESY